MVRASHLLLGESGEGERRCTVKLHGRFEACGMTGMLVGGTRETAPRYGKYVVTKPGALALQGGNDDPDVRNKFRYQSPHADYRL